MGMPARGDGSTLIRVIEPLKGSGVYALGRIGYRYWVWWRLRLSLATLVLHGNLHGGLPSKRPDGTETGNDA